MSLRASLLRVTRLAAVGFLALCPAVLSAQDPDKPKPPVTFNAVTLHQSIRDLFYDLGHKRIPVAAGPTALSRSYTAPADGSLVLYRLAPPAPPSTEPVKVPVAKLTLGDKGPYLLLFSDFVAGTLQVRVIDNSWETNPPLSSRIINASRRKTAVKLDGGMAELAPGELHTFAPPSKPIDVIDLKIATLDSAQWNLRVLAPQALYPSTRNTFIVKEQLPSLENPNPVDLDIFTIVDASQPPPRKP